MTRPSPSPIRRPVRFEHAYLVMDHGHVRLSPARCARATRIAQTLEADYAIDGDTLDLAIVTDSMNVRRFGRRSRSPPFRGSNSFKAVLGAAT